MRILIVTQRYYPLVGGAEQALRSLAGGFTRRGHDVLVLAARYTGELATKEQIDGVPIHRLPLPPVRYLGTATYVGAVLRALRGPLGRADVAYVSMLKHAAWAALQARRGTQLPVVLRAEGGGRTGDVAWQRTALFGRGIAATCRQADAIVAVSRAVYNELLSFGYPRERVQLIPNAVDCNRFRPPTPDQRLAARRSLGVRGPVVLYVGRIAPEKGLDLLASAWPQVRRSCPDAALLVAGGPTEGPLAARLAGLAGVRLLGPTSDVPTLLRAADLFVLPSRYEGTSIALLEAMASGLPVVASDIPGNREVIGHDPEAGVLVPPEAAEPLADAIQRVLENESLRADLGHAARQRVLDEFSLERSVERHLELFRTVIERRRTR